MSQSPENGSRHSDVAQSYLRGVTCSPSQSPENGSRHSDRRNMRRFAVAVLWSQSPENGSRHSDWGGQRQPVVLMVRRNPLKTGLGTPTVPSPFFFFLPLYAWKPLLGQSSSRLRLSFYHLPVCLSSFFLYFSSPCESPLKIGHRRDSRKSGADPRSGWPISGGFAHENPHIWRPPEPGPMICESLQALGTYEDSRKHLIIPTSWSFRGEAKLSPGCVTGWPRTASQSTRRSSNQMLFCTRSSIPHRTRDRRSRRRSSGMS